MQYDCITNDVHVVAPFAVRLSAVRRCSTKLRPCTAMDVTGKYQLQNRVETLPTFRPDALVFFRVKIS